jgi:hypothetical protein
MIQFGLHQVNLLRPELCIRLVRMALFKMSPHWDGFVFRLRRLTGVVLILMASVVAEAGTLIDELNRYREAGELVTLGVTVYGQKVIPLTGTVMFVGAPDVPDLLGLKDTKGTLHLLKADSRFVSLVSQASPSSQLVGEGDIPSINIAARDSRLFWNIHRDKTRLNSFLKSQGFDDLTKDVRFFANKYRELLASIIFGGFAGITIYTFFLDSTAPLYVGEFGFRPIMDHISSFLGSLYPASLLQGMFRLDRGGFRLFCIRILVAGGLTSFHYGLENPFGLIHSDVPSDFNVQDPIDFWVGATTAWLAVFSDKILNWSDFLRTKTQHIYRSAKLRCIDTFVKKNP